MEISRMCRRLFVLFLQGTKLHPTELTGEIP
jgi:hypothetical protein